MVTATLPDVRLDAGGLDELTVEECWQLLATQRVGRVAIIAGHYPLVFPVNFAVDERAILYRTGVGAKLHALHRSNVTFEVDFVDPVRQSGWSVMVKGVAQELSGPRHPVARDRAEAGGATPWAPGQREHLVRIVADHVTGRRVRPAQLPPATDQRGYL
jgi:nitroimidazol reductase NimA-like FMN-containing flavoprotein (pyridoxamine 5'-phosphate oxidase superfamily)